MLEPTVFIVDDDASVRNSLRWLIQPLRYHVETYACAADFLESFDPQRPGCLLLDVRMPGMSGLDLLERLVAQEVHPPIILVTGHADVPMCVRAFRSGVFGFIEKPAQNETLLDSIRSAIALDAAQREERAKRREIQARLDQLSPREREVMDLLVAGKETKHISAILGVSLQTVAKHRTRIFEKACVKNQAELTRLALLIEPSAEATRRG